MPDEDVIQRLTRVPARDGAGLARLADDVAAAADEAPRAVVGEWARGSPESGAKASLVGLQLEELALAALLDEAGRAAGVRKIDLLGAAVECAVRLRDLVLLQFDALLLDRTALPAADPGGRPSRVCDEAYGLIARLLDVIGVREPPLRSAEEFLSLPGLERDETLQAWDKSQTRATIQATARRFS